MFPTPLQQWPAPARGLYRIAVPLALLVWLVPLLAVLVTSVRGAEDIALGRYWTWPRDPSAWANYRAAMTESPMARYFLNSLLVTVPTVAGTLLVSSMAGYALGVYRFRGNALLFGLFVAGNFMPFQILMLPVRELALDTGLYDTRSGLALFHTAFQTGFCTLYIRGFVKQLPFELIEAARVEGASEWTVFWRVVLPLIRPALASLAVLSFTFVWNDYFWALTLTQSDDARPLMVGITQLKGTWTTRWELVAAASVVAALPCVLLFFAMQKHFIAGLTSGATKG